VVDIDAPAGTLESGHLGGAAINVFPIRRASRCPWLSSRQVCERPQAAVFALMSGLTLMRSLSRRHGAQRHCGCRVAVHPMALCR
jgi:hypothetical protein